MPLNKRVFLLLAFFALGLGSGGFATPASGAPPAPALMPGFPMQAGTVVMVMWGPVPGGVKYRVYIDDKMVAEVPMPPFQTNVPEKPGEYRFAVTSVDAAGAESEKSKPGLLRIVGLEPPKEISGLVDMASKHVVLRWGAAPGAMIYNLFRSEKEAEQGALVQSLQDTRYVDKGIEANKTYYYRVTAKDATGKESKPSAPFAANTAVAAAAAGEATKKMIDIIPIPTTTRFENKSLPSYPSDIQVLDDGSVYVSVDKVVYFDSFDSGEPKPLGDRFPGTQGLGSTRDGMLIIVQQWPNKVSIVRPASGEVSFSFSVPEMKEKFVANGKPIEPAPPKPFDAVQLENGNFVVTDQVNRRVVLLDPQGKFLKNCGQESDHHLVFGSSFIAVSPNGGIYAVSGLGNKVVIFDGECNYKGEFGETGNAVGTFGRVMGIDVDSKGNVWVADMGNATVQKFSPEGEFLGVLTDATKKANAAINTPTGITVKEAGKVISVVESSTKQMKQFDVKEQ